MSTQEDTDSKLLREDEIAARQEAMFNSHPDLLDMERRAGEQATLDGIQQATEDSSARAGNDANTDSLRRGEVTSPSNFRSTVGTNPKSTKKSRFKFLRGKKKGLAVGGIVGGTGIIGLLFTLFGPLSMVINLTENFLDTNDGAQSAFERRITKVLGMKLGQPDPLCDSKKVKCKMGRVATSGLKKLAKKGVVARDAAGNDLSKATGRYPDAAISVYEIDGKNIKPGDIKGYLVSDKRLAAKIFGRSGAFNLRFEMWRGGVMKKHFYDRFGIKRDGGIADGKNKSGSKLSEITQKVKERIPGIDGLKDKATVKINTKTEKMLGRGKKGGTAYLTAVGGCVVSQAPTMITYGVAAIQAARLAPLFSDVVASPGSKAKSSMISSFTSEDAEVVGKVLTEQDSNGKSALDSKFLQQAIGVNTSKTGVSKDFAPGYKLLTNPAISAINEVNSNGAKKSTCNAILSSQAMYSAIALNSALNVAASATIIGGVIKVTAEFVIGEVVAKIAGKAVTALSDKLMEELAQSDDLDAALSAKPGEKFGDALGTSAMIFSSAGGAARNVPVLRENQLAAYNTIQNEQMEFDKAIAIASLSPFDISSKYTFLGSIVNSANMSIIKNGGAKNYTGSLLTYLGTLPMNILQPSVGAASSETSCSYAEEFGMEADNGATPAVNSAGMPCYGYTGNMSAESALAIATGNNTSKKSWVNEGDVNEEAPLEDIVEEDSQLAAYLSGCGAQSIEDGEWNSTASGCTVDTKGSNETLNPVPICVEAQAATTPCYVTEGEVTATPSTAAESEAVAAFAMDYQISQMIDGFDEEPTTTSTESDESITTPSLNVDNLQKPIDCPVDSSVKDIGLAKTQYTGSLVQTNKPTIRLCQISLIEGFGQNGLGSRISGGAIVNAGAAAQFLNLAKAAKQDGITLKASDSFRLGASGGGSGNGTQYATAGGSNHQIGVAIDFRLTDRALGSSGSGSTTSCSQRMTSVDPSWKWLNTKAAAFGIKQYSYESWHWDVDISRANRCSA